MMDRFSSTTVIYHGREVDWPHIADRYVPTPPGELLAVPRWQPPGAPDDPAATVAVRVTDRCAYVDRSGDWSVLIHTAQDRHEMGYIAPSPQLTHRTVDDVIAGRSDDEAAAIEELAVRFTRAGRDRDVPGPWAERHIAAVCDVANSTAALLRLPPLTDDQVRQLLRVETTPEGIRGFGDYRAVAEWALGHRDTPDEEST